MNSSILRIFAVAVIAAGSFATLSARPSQPSNGTASVGPGGPQTPIPICPSCGRGANPN